MEYFTDIEKITDGLRLTGYEKKGAGPAKEVVRRELGGNLSEQARKLSPLFPCRVKIILKPEDMIFTNVTIPVSDERLIAGAVAFEFRKHFRIDPERFFFTHHVWQKSSDGCRITLFGADKTVFDWKLEACRAGFIPCFEIDGFTVENRGTSFVIEKGMNGSEEILKIYHDGFLIGWNRYEKKQFKPAFSKAGEYAGNLGLKPPKDVLAAEKTQSSPKILPFQAGVYTSMVKPLLKRRLLAVSGVFAGLALVFYLAASFLRIAAGLTRLNEVDGQIRDLAGQYQIKDLNAVNAVSEEKHAKISGLIEDLGAFFPKNRKIKGLEYNGGETVITVPAVSILEANEIIDALGRSNMFSRFRILDGANSNENRIAFQVKNQN